MTSAMAYRLGAGLVVAALAAGVLALKVIGNGGPADRAGPTPVADTASRSGAGADPAVDGTPDGPPVPDRAEAAEAAAGGADGTAAGDEAAAPAPLPRLVDLGAGTCIPCKMMQPILEALTEEFDGRMRVEVIDVYEERAKAQSYRIRVIPTQIFIAPDGTELARHEGFMSRDDILEQWRHLGFGFE